MNEPQVTYCAVCGKVRSVVTVNPTANAAAGNYPTIQTVDLTTNAGNYPVAIVQQYPQVAGAAGVWMPSWDMCICPK